MPRIIYAILLIVVTLPGLIWYRQTGDLGLYFTDAVPAGQLLYVFSKLAGLYALLCILLQIIFGLATRPGIALMQPVRWLHPVLGSCVVLLALAHLLLFFAAVSIRQEIPAWGLLFPGFMDFYHVHLSLGLFGLWLLLVVMISGTVLAGKRSPVARLLHRGYWLSVALVYLHALAIGTESQTAAGMLFYGLLGGIVLILLLARLIRQNRSAMVYPG